MPINIDKIDRRVSMFLLVLVPIGLVCALVGSIIPGSDEDRFVLGGLSLALAAIVGTAAYWQIRIGKTPVRETTWSSRMKWADKQDRPFRYWFTTIMYVFCSVTLFVFSILILLFSPEFLGDRGLK
jgi:hypothetical protein